MTNTGRIEIGFEDVGEILPAIVGAESGNFVFTRFFEECLVDFEMMKRFGFVFHRIYGGAFGIIVDKCDHVAEAFSRLLFIGADIGMN